MAFKGSQSKFDGKNSSWQYRHASILVGEEAVRITFKDKDEDDDLGGGDSIKVDITDLPTIPHMPKKGTTITDCVVFLDTKKNKVMAINPWAGRFEAQAIELGPKSEDGELPVFVVSTRKGDNGDYDDKKFWCSYKITADPDNNGLFVGCTPRYHLKYRFAEGDDGLVGLDGNPENPKATRVRQLQKWTAVHGIDADMPWPDDGNVLPGLQTRLKGGNAVNITIEDGYIQNVTKLFGSAVAVVPDEPEPTVQGGDSASWAEKPGLKDDTFGDHPK